MKTKAQILAAAGGSHEAAFEALYADYAAAVNAHAEAGREAERNAGESIRARSIAKALEPLAEALGIALPEKGKRPSQESEATMQSAVQTALTELEENPALDAALALLEEYQERTGIDASGVLDKLPQNATEAQFQAALDAAFAPLTALQADAQTGRLTQAAAFAGLPVDAIKELLDGKQFEARTVKGQDGKDVEVWGTVQGEKFTSLKDLKSVQLLSGTTNQESQQLPGFQLNDGQGNVNSGSQSGGLLSFLDPKPADQSKKD